MNPPYKLNTTVRMLSTDPITGAGFTNLDTGLAFDPSTVTLVYSDPTGAEFTIPMGSLTRTATGIWKYETVVSISGRWKYNFEGSGNCNVTSGDSSFLVASSALIAG